MLVLLILSGCSQVKLSDYRKNTPQFNVREFFDGNLVAHGVVKNRNGKVIRSFTATIAASWSGHTGTLDETFIFSDSEVQNRIWTLQKVNDNNYTAIAWQCSVHRVHAHHQLQGLAAEYSRR